MPEVLTTPPKEYRHPTEWPEYAIEQHIPPFMHPHYDPARRLLSIRFGPIRVLEFRGTAEPTIGADDIQNGVTICMWRRPTYDNAVPRGWVRFSKQSGGRTGIAIAEEGYRKKWSKTARYDANCWDRLKTQGFKVESCAWSEFKKAYLKSTAGKKVGSIMVGIVDRLLSSSPDSVNLRIIRNPGNKIIEAGAAFVSSKTMKSSYDYASFYTKSSTHLPLMVGIIDDWFRRSLDQGIITLHFGIFWKPGDPKSWKGYSNFKAKFGVSYIDEAPTLYKFVFKTGWFS